MGRIKFMRAAALIAVVVGALLTPVLAQGPTWTSSKIEKYNGYDYELWNQDNAGNVSMKLTGDNGSSVGGTFEASWSNTKNVLFRSGRKFTNTSGQSVDGGGAGKTAAALGNISINFAATWSSNDNVKMLGVYGWAFFASGSAPSNFSNQIEYYIIQDRGSYNSATSGTNSSKKGSATIDGIAYDFYVCDRMGQPMLTGNGNFKQYFSVPQSTSNHRTSGTITVSKHFEEWVKAGMKMDGPLYEVAMKVESYSGNGQSNGQAKVTKNILTIGAAATTNFTLTTAVSPTGSGTITQSPTGSSFSSGATVTLTPVAKTGYKFDKWSGDASGTANPLSVTMDKNKNITATFVDTTTKTFTLTTTVNPANSGTITPSPAKPASGKYDSATVVKLTAVPEAGWAFDGWDGDASGTKDTVSVVMNKDKSVTAKFKQSPTGIARGAAAATKIYKMSVATLSNNALIVNFVAAGSGQTAVKLYNLRGDALSTATLRTVAGNSYTHTIDAVNLPDGFYVVGIVGEKGAEHTRVAVYK